MFYDGKKEEILNKLVMSHQESLLNINMIDKDSGIIKMR